jgi:hypothetical protein
MTSKAPSLLGTGAWFHIRMSGPRSRAEARLT